MARGLRFILSNVPNHPVEELMEEDGSTGADGEGDADEAEPARPSRASADDEKNLEEAREAADAFMKLFIPRPSSIGHMLTQVTCTIEEQTYEAENIDCTRARNDMDMAEKE